MRGGGVTKTNKTIKKFKKFKKNYNFSSFYRKKARKGEQFKKGKKQYRMLLNGEECKGGK